MKVKIQIGGMSCQHCANHVREALNKFDFIKDLTVDFKNSSAQFTLLNNLRATDVKNSLAEALSEFAYELQNIEECVQEEV